MLINGNGWRVVVYLEATERRDWPVLCIFIQKSFINLEYPHDVKNLYKQLDWIIKEYLTDDAVSNFQDRMVLRT